MAYRRNLPELLISTFHWQHHHHKLNHIVVDHCLLVANKIGLIGKQYKDKKASINHILDILGKIEDKYFVELLIKPGVFSLLTQIRRVGSRSFLEFLANQIWLLNPDYISIEKFDAPTWSADGSIYLPSLNRKFLSLSPAPYCKFRADLPYFAPVINDNLVIDFYSPIAKSTYDFYTETSRPMKEIPAFSVNEEDHIVTRLNEAFSLIKRSSIQTSNFINTYTRTIVPQKTLSLQQRKFASGSCCSDIGRTAITNPHLEDITSAAIASALIHESIHDFLYLLEIREPLICTKRLLHSNRRMLISTWSNTKLRPRAFIHAIFVWYGLLNFWTLPSVKNYFPINEVNYQIEKSLKGFLDSRLELEIEKLAPHLNKTIRSLLKDLCNRARYFHKIGDNI